MSNFSLCFSSGSYELFAKRETTDGFESFKQKVFERDQHKCLFCGFRATKHMWVVNRDRNYRNNKMSNMATACPLCKQCFFIEHVNAMGGGGTLIYLPEMTQADVNGLCHSLFCAIANATVHERTAQDTYNTLKLRSNAVESVYGEGRSDPKVFGEMVLNTPIEGIEKISYDVLRDLRLLPKLASFKQQIKDWSQDASVASAK